MGSFAKRAALGLLVNLGLGCGGAEEATPALASGGKPAASNVGGGSGSSPVTAGGTEAGGPAQEPRGEAGTAGSGGASEADCAAAKLDGLEVHAEGTWDPLGYPPYALDACTLVYVASASGADDGALRLRDLSTGAEVELAPGSAHPRRPAVAGNVVAWESDGEDGSQVRVRDSAGAEPFEMTFRRAGEPRVAADAVVFTAFVGDGANADTDVQLYELSSHVLTPIGTGAGQQRLADVSATHVAFTDFSEDPKGYFDQSSGTISDIVLIDRETSQRTVRALPGKQAFPLLGSGGLLAYLEWGSVHPEPKFSQFFLKTGYVDAPVDDDRNVKGDKELISTDPAYVRPSLHASYLDYVDKVNNEALLFRANLDEPARPSAATSLGSARLLGPVATATFTLVAKRREDQKLELVTVAR